MGRMEEEIWNVILKRIKRNVFVLMNLALERVNVVSVSLIIKIWVKFRDVYFRPK